jgi:hypothetical protein
MNNAQRLIILPRTGKTDFSLKNLQEIKKGTGYFFWKK